MRHAQPGEPWTLERANRALPLVSRIADDIVHRYADWQALVGAYEIASMRDTPHAPDPEALRLAEAIQRVAADVDGFVRELTKLGVECKSMEQGLLDFRGELEGRPVYFCWMRGERTVAHWHEIDAGFAGRQPV